MEVAVRSVFGCVVSSQSVWAVKVWWRMKSAVKVTSNWGWAVTSFRDGGIQQWSGLSWLEVPWSSRDVRCVWSIDVPGRATRFCCRDPGGGDWGYTPGVCYHCPGRSSRSGGGGQLHLHIRSNEGQIAHTRGWWHRAWNWLKVGSLSRTLLCHNRVRDWPRENLPELPQALLCCELPHVLPNGLNPHCRIWLLPSGRGVLPLIRESSISNCGNAIGLSAARVRRGVRATRHWPRWCTPIPQPPKASTRVGKLSLTVRVTNERPVLTWQGPAGSVSCSVWRTSRSLRREWTIPTMPCEARWLVWFHAGRHSMGETAQAAPRREGRPGVCASGAPRPAPESPGQSPAGSSGCWKIAPNRCW